MKLLKIHVDVANDLSLGQLSMQAIADKHDIRSRQTIYDWMACQEFKDFLTKLEEGHKRMALLMARRWATEAVKRLVMNFTNKDIDPEVARKSAMDLLDIAGLKIQKVEGEGIGGSPVFIIQTNHNQPKTEDKPQDVSKRFRLE